MGKCRLVRHGLGLRSSESASADACGVGCRCCNAATADRGRPANRHGFRCKGPQRTVLLYWRLVSLGHISRSVLDTMRRRSGARYGGPVTGLPGRWVAVGEPREQWPTRKGPEEDLGPLGSPGRANPIFETLPSFAK